MFRSSLSLEETLEKSHFCVFLLIAFESSSIVLFVAVLQILKIVYAKGNPLTVFIYSSFFLVQFVPTQTPTTDITVALVLCWDTFKPDEMQHFQTRRIFVSPCNTLTCDKHSTATPGFPTVAFSQNYKETADGIQHFLVIWNYLSAEQREDKEGHVTYCLSAGDSNLKSNR